MSALQYDFGTTGQVLVRLQGSLHTKHQIPFGQPVLLLHVDVLWVEALLGFAASALVLFPLYYASLCHETSSFPASKVSWISMGNSQVHTSSSIPANGVQA